MQLAMQDYCDSQVRLFFPTACSFNQIGGADYLVCTSACLNLESDWLVCIAIANFIKPYIPYRGKVHMYIATYD